LFLQLLEDLLPERLVLAALEEEVQVLDDDALGNRKVRRYGGTAVLGTLKGSSDST
jgi:hypothetical protein